MTGGNQPVCRRLDQPVLLRYANSNGRDITSEAIANRAKDSEGYVPISAFDLSEESSYDNIDFYLPAKDAQLTVSLVIGDIEVTDGSGHKSSRLQEILTFATSAAGVLITSDRSDSEDGQPHMRKVDAAGSDLA